jgi:acetyl-CoA acetyltransferase family protein
LNINDVFIVDAVRTKIGRLGGAASGVRADDLAAAPLKALVERQVRLDPAQIDDVIFGDANAAGEDNRDVARMAVLLAGLPTSVPGATVNRLCGSGMEAAIQATRAIATGDASLVVAGGVESMSRAPWVLLKPEQPFPRGHETLWSTTLGWRMVNPKMPPQWTVSLGEGAELLADKYSIGRDAQDAFALASHQKAASAWQAGEFISETIDVDGIELLQDESIRVATTFEQLGKLKPVFRENGTVTAGNSSPLNDGASALLLADQIGLDTIGARPLARIASRAVSGVEPQFFGIGPVETANEALRKAGINWSDLASVELNEAFAVQSLACMAEWPDLDPAIVNPFGGAIAIGHPLGASGARLLTTLAWRLHNSGKKWGLAAMCIGVGQGIAVVLEGM